MATQTTSQSTSLKGEEVIIRTAQFFSTEKWKVTSQHSRSIILERRAPFPWHLLVLTIVGYLMCILPGIIISVIAKKKARRIFHLIVNVNPISGGAEVCVQYPDEMKELALKFIGTLPSLGA